MKILIVVKSKKKLVEISRFVYHRNDFSRHKPTFL